MLITLVGAVLSGVRAFVVPDLDEPVVACCYKGTEKWPKPVYPVVVREGMVDNAGAE